MNLSQEISMYQKLFGPPGGGLIRIIFANLKFQEAPVGREISSSARYSMRKPTFREGHGVRVFPLQENPPLFLRRLEGESRGATALDLQQRGLPGWN